MFKKNDILINITGAVMICSITKTICNCIARMCGDDVPEVPVVSIMRNKNTDKKENAECLQ